MDSLGGESGGNSKHYPLELTPRLPPHVVGMEAEEIIL